MTKFIITRIAFTGLIFYSCSSGNDEKTEVVSTVAAAQKEVVSQPSSNVLTADSSINAQYEQTIAKGSFAEIKLSKESLVNIKAFSERTVNEEILTIGNIDGLGVFDTIRSTLRVINDTVYIHSQWRRNNELIWELKLVDPYMHVNENNPLFEYENSPVWTRLTIAKDYAIPELSNKSKYNHIGTKWVINSGMYDFKESNLKVDSASYAEYLSNFDGQLLEYGEPEIRKLAIWHEPTKKFVSYYSP